MATRVLNTIYKNNKLWGFRIICSRGEDKGIHILSLPDAKVYVYKKEKFENVKLGPGNQWEGIESSIERFPAQDLQGNWMVNRENKGSYFVLGKMMENNHSIGFKLMDLDGNIAYKNIDETLNIGRTEGFINAKIVMKENKEFISALRGKIKEYEKKEDSVMDDKMKDSRYKELSQYFKDSNKKKVVIDLATHLGARTPSELSKKLHTYLGEPKTMTDKDIMDKLAMIYAMSNGNVSAPAPVAAPTSAPAPAVQKDETVKTVEPDKVASKNPDIIRMRELIKVLTKAAEQYYSGDDSMMSDYEYDKLYDELTALENKTGVIFSDSLTQKVGFEVKGSLVKVKHPSKMLSLDKTKDRVELSKALGGQPGFLGWKLDGLTCVVKYDNGELVQAVTRGNGVIGEDVTHNAKVFKGVPLKISYTQPLVIRGEALISYEDFEKINAKITNVCEKYKNPRNLASGSVRQLDSKIAKERHVQFKAFTVVEGFDECTKYSEKLNKLKDYGFDVVEFVMVKPDEVVDMVGKFEKRVKNLPYPTDGLVVTIDDIAYGDMLGMTAKFPKNAKAFKWKDEAVESDLRDIEWSVGRTGAITPVAIFDPIDIEGSTVRRASLHNVSVMHSLLGDKPFHRQHVWVIKSNMIIPTIVKSDKTNVNNEPELSVPSVCPICGKPTKIIKSLDAQVLVCENPDCAARHLGTLSHFVSRECLNIDGLSEATLETFVNEGYIKEFKDIYHLNDYADDIMKLEGFGKTSYNKLWKAIEKSRNCELPAFIGALGIPNMGKTTSKDVCKALDYDLEKLITYPKDKLEGIDGIGTKTADSIYDYFEENRDMVRELAKEFTFKAMPKINHNSPISGMTFCITGEVYQFKNRKELQEKIESLGAKASSSVSGKTDYLINNDVTSSSSKNLTAKRLGVPIISETDFLNML